uniref:DYW domain-containing protein n=1 Tax=Kalanchoe fedtschenkoi TaxID=63787 RepID=A0A7N0R989_KALFE
MMLADVAPSNYTFTAVVKACADLAALRVGRVVHSHILGSGHGSDPFVQAGLVAFYSKCGDLDVARKVFDKMPERTIIAWNAMISGYEQNGSGTEAIKLFNQMVESGVEMDSATFVGVLSTCAQVGALELGCWVHDHIVRNSFDVNVVLGSSLVNMYGRCGNVKKAREVFDSMKDHNVVAWTAMITGYGMHGYGREALELFHRMRRDGLAPNYVTFISVLSACAHAGLVAEGQEVFASMRRDYKVFPGTEHHVCMVDMLGRSGFLDQAYSFVREEIPSKPAPAVWTAMLAACKMHKNFDLGVEVAEHLLASEPENPSHYVLVSNMYALGGRMDRVEHVRNRMIHRGMKKQVGYSVIELDQKAYLFSMGDKSHFQTREIYRYLDELMLKCSEAGYAPAQGSVMHEVEEEEEREYALRHHSEKLAIAFGLLNTEPGTRIRIVKNLRVCEDCHLAIKVMSSVTQREIVVRDKLRFHHFKDGACSCGDYW